MFSMFFLIRLKYGNMNDSDVDVKAGWSEEMQTELWLDECDCVSGWDPTSALSTPYRSWCNTVVNMLLYSVYWKLKAL